MLRRERLPHAILLTGPLGSGKLTMALDLGKAVNCLAPGQDGSPCGSCDSCVRVNSRVHPDLFLLEPQGRSLVHPIADIRRYMREMLVYKPYGYKTKVAIIRCAERLKEENGGALLKTLEEPTDNTLIILTAPDQSSVMGTLVSRCVTLRIPPLSPETARAELLARQGLSGPQAELTLALAGGALGQALSLNSARAFALWEKIGAIFGSPKGAARLEAASAFTGEIVAEMERLKKADRESDKASSKRAGEEAGGESEAVGDGAEGGDFEFLNLLYRLLRLFFRDAAALGATGSDRFLAGPAPSADLWRFAKNFPPRAYSFYEAKVSLLADSIARYFRPEFAWENFWVSLLI
jgi:DNA polymerase III delta prime subunit